MKKKIMLRIIPILTAVLLTAGCAQSEKPNGQADKASVSSAEESIAEFEPVPRPEGGWTYEEVAKTVYINGKQISYPFTIESLGKGYSIKKKTTEVEGNGDVWTTLYYHDTPVCSLKYNDLNSSDGLESKNVSSIGIADVDNLGNECSYEMIKANGISVFDDSFVIKEMFGEPDLEAETGWICTYKERNTDKTCLSFITEDNKVTGISVFLDEKF